MSFLINANKALTPGTVLRLQLRSHQKTRAPLSHVHCVIGTLRGLRSILLSSLAFRHTTSFGVPRSPASCFIHS